LKTHVLKVKKNQKKGEKEKYREKKRKEKSREKNEKNHRRGGTAPRQLAGARATAPISSRVRLSCVRSRVL
jgi:hypothetical protein